MSSCLQCFIMSKTIADYSMIYIFYYTLLKTKQVPNTNSEYFLKGRPYNSNFNKISYLNHQSTELTFQQVYKGNSIAILSIIKFIKCFFKPSITKRLHRTLSIIVHNQSARFPNHIFRKVFEFSKSDHNFWLKRVRKNLHLFVNFKETSQPIVSKNQFHRLAFKLFKSINKHTYKLTRVPYL